MTLEFLALSKINNKWSRKFHRRIDKFFQSGTYEEMAENKMGKKWSLNYLWQTNNKWKINQMNSAFMICEEENCHHNENIPCNSESTESQ